MGTDTRQTIERFWHTANARDWGAFAALLHPEVVYLVPQTRERAVGRDAFVDVFRTWPGDWVAHLELLIAERDAAVSTIRFEVAGEAATGISFFVLRDGLITRITDHWPEDYEPPARVTPHLQRDPVARG